MHNNNNNNNNNNCTLIRGKSLKPGKKNILNLILNVEKSTLIKGTVYSNKNVPSVGASIKVVEIDPFDNKRKILGCTYTDDKGEYQFKVIPIPYMIYEFTVYSPLKQ
ncbi:hypothetical protein KPL37_10005 [Clostridium frigoris]|uniref:Carboxypeptidase regulatory-like domain-containing protein n=1 Tax=Clostridium frigoris TaxID=205327 RepID=A0ABS6BT51_9CLOT|nr:hypothetical protein [Clostridium frigoris]MBU3160086.1 hypothetical protein [Clostridium frigoris]